MTYIHIWLLRMAMYSYYVSTNAFKIGIPTRILISPSAFLIRKVEVVLPIVDMVNLPFKQNIDFYFTNKKSQELCVFDIW